MTNLFFFLFFFSVTSLFLFERVYINIKKDENYEMEIHFVFFVLVLREEKRKKKKGLTPSLSAVITSAAKLCHLSDIEINGISVKKQATDAVKSIREYYRYSSLYYALISFLSTNAASLSVGEDAFTVSDSDESRLAFDINISAYLIDALIALTPLLLSMIKRRRKERFNVRKQNE